MRPSRRALVDRHCDAKEDVSPRNRKRRSSVREPTRHTKRVRYRVLVIFESLNASPINLYDLKLRKSIEISR